jgi:hypothetical protein
LVSDGDVDIVVDAYTCIDPTFLLAMSCLQFRPPTPDMQQPPQQQEHTYPPVPIDGAPNAASPSGWAEYIKRLGKKDASVGVSRTWVKKGRDVDAKEESERGCV